MALDDSGLGVFNVLVAGAIALVLVTVIALLGLTLVGGMTSGLADDLTAQNRTSSPDPVTGAAVSFEDTSPGSGDVTQVYRVNDSTGYAVELTGANDSYVRSQGGVDLYENDTFTASTWARVNSSSSGETMTVLAAGSDVTLQYNGTDGNWTAWYYESSTGDSYRVDVDAANQPDNLTWVAAWRNETHFTIYRNTTQGEIVNISASNRSASGEFNASNFNGTLEETRVFDEALNSSERSGVVNNPVAPRPEANRTLRVMYDEGSGSTTALYFAGGERADLSNFSWVHGHDGHVLTEGTDYEIDLSDGTITALAGGRIDGAPVVWIDYEFKPSDRILDLVEPLGTAFGLLSTSTLVIPAAAILAVLIGGVIGSIAFARGRNGLNLDFRRGDR